MNNIVSKLITFHHKHYLIGYKMRRECVIKYSSHLRLSKLRPPVT